MSFKNLIAKPVISLGAAGALLFSFNAASAGDCKGVRNNPRAVMRAMPDNYFKNNYEWKDLSPAEKDLLARVSISARNARIKSSCVPFTNFHPKSIKDVLWADGEHFDGDALPALNRMFIAINTDPNIRAEGDYIIISSGYRSFQEQLSVWAPSLKGYFFKIKNSLGQYLEYVEEDLKDSIKENVTKTDKAKATKVASNKPSETSKDEGDAQGDVKIAETQTSLVKEEATKANASNTKSIHKNINDLAPSKQDNKAKHANKQNSTKASAASKKEVKINPRYNDFAVVELRSFAGARFAFPGFSTHQRGNAVDLQIIDDNGRRLSADTSQANINRWCQTPTFKWLVKNAHKYGFVQGKIDEPWHWEYHPDKAKNRNDIAFYAPSCRKYLRT